MQNVAIWDRQSLIVHLIENDLKNVRLRYDFQEYPQYDLKRSSLNQSIFALLGITEPLLLSEFSRYYSKLRREINTKDFSPGELNFLSVRTFQHLNAKSQKSTVLLRQGQYLKHEKVEFDYNNIIVNLIKNELIQKSNLEMLPDFVKREHYIFTIHKPALWMMKIWDKKLQDKFQSYYFGLIDKVIEKESNSVIQRIDFFAEDIFNKIRDKKTSVFI